MSIRVSSCGTAFVGLVMASSLSAVEDEPVIEVNPVGRPAAFAKGNAVRYFLWNDVEGWHVHTDSGGKAHRFTGTIEVLGGKVTKIENFGRLEPGKKKKRSDIGVLNKAKNQIAFRFTTSVRRDGFSFKVDESAKQVRFRLLIDGKPAPLRTLIGANGQPAPGPVLLLPAHPE